MVDSLSLVWPVQNVERVLTRQVHELVELLPELTARFELILVDDASTDHTDDVADDLSRVYPQVRLVRGQTPRGPAEAAVGAFAEATGDYVYLHADAGPIDTGELRRLWMVRHRPLGAELNARPRGLLHRLSNWAGQLSALADQAAVAPAARLVRRDQAAALRPALLPALPMTANVPASVEA